MMAPKTIKVDLTYADALFITESIGLNVPDEAEMTPTQRHTARKMERARARLWSITQ